MRTIEKKINFLGKTLKDERKKLNLTQKQLCQISGVSLKALRNIEQGKYNVSLTIANKIFNHFGKELRPMDITSPPVIKKQKKISKKQVLEILQKIVPILKIKYKINQFGLFGSFARETQKLDSDIDILIKCKKHLGLKEIGELILLLEVMLEGRKVDIVLSNSIKNDFRENILEDIIYV